MSLCFFLYIYKWDCECLKATNLHSSLTYLHNTEPITPPLEDNITFGAVKRNLNLCCCGHTKSTTISYWSSVYRFVDFTFLIHFCEHFLLDIYFCNFIFPYKSYQDTNVNWTIHRTITHSYNICYWTFNGKRHKNNKCNSQSISKAWTFRKHNK